MNFETQWDVVRYAAIGSRLGDCVRELQARSERGPLQRVLLVHNDRAYLVTPGGHREVGTLPADDLDRIERELNAGRAK